MERFVTGEGALGNVKNRICYGNIDLKERANKNS